MDTTQIRALGACPEALDWLEAQNGGLYDAWRRCDRGDWMLWLAARVGIDRRFERPLAGMSIGQQRATCRHAVAKLRRPT